MHIFLEVLKILNFAFFRMHIKLIQKSRNDSQLHEVMIHIETKIRALVIRSNSLLEKCLIAPVGEGLGYRFCQPVPHNRDQRLSLRHRVKEPVPKALVITEKIYARMW